MSHFKKILIANRGEIAVRIIRTAQKLGIKTVAIFAEDDRHSLHVQLADETFLLPGHALCETYLNQKKIIELARQTNADAIHPGYGFLSENADFAKKTEEANLAFVGATPAQIELMGEKTKAINFAKALGLPVIPGVQGSAMHILDEIASLEFPVLIKASAGGGGKGMQIVETREELPKALQRAQRQAQEYFGNDELFVEKFLPYVRHIEVQLAGDGKGNAIHLFERECSIQRRHQKLIEEAPATSISNKLRTKLYDYALQIAKAIKYRGAGTIEFLVDEQGNCYFLEMNTRLQVEHAVTEAITGIDLVEWQLLIASGDELPMHQEEIIQNGHAIEVRICAEDPGHQFAPSSGKVEALHIPPSARWESFLSTGITLSPAYDSLLGKIVAIAGSREEALQKMELALTDLFIAGLKTNQSFLFEIIQSEPFRQNNLSTLFIETNLSSLLHKMDARLNQIPDDLLAVAYVLHHFYRPTNSTNGWDQLGYWRLLPHFKIETERASIDLYLIKRNGLFMLQIRDKPVILSDVSFKNEKITWQKDGEISTFFAAAIPGQTIVQHLGCSFALKSYHVPGQFKLNPKTGHENSKRHSQVVAELFGKVIDVLAKPGDRLKKGQGIVVIESMKTEFIIQSPADAIVKTMYATTGNIVQDKEILAELEY